jgi:hypothetical protein
VSLRSNGFISKVQKVQFQCQLAKLQLEGLVLKRKLRESFQIRTPQQKWQPLKCHLQN